MIQEREPAAGRGEVEAKGKRTCDYYQVQSHEQVNSGGIWEKVGFDWKDTPKNVEKEAVAHESKSTSLKVSCFPHPNSPRPGN